MNVSAVLVTRGDVDLSDIIDSFGVPECSPIKETIIWDNSERDDFAVYGRYAAIAEAKHDLIYTQDDDVVLPPESIQALIRAYDPEGNLVMHDGPGSYLVANMPQPFRHDFYADHSLVGFGAMFHRDLPAKAFDRFEESPLSGRTYLEKAPPFKREHRGNVIVQSGSPHRKDYVLNEEFWRTCDIVFTALTPRVLVDVPYRNLPWAEDETRMYRSENHVAERTRMLELVRKVRDA